MSYIKTNSDILLNETSRNVYSQMLNPNLNVEWNNIYGKPYGLDNIGDYSADIEQLKIDVETLQEQIRNLQPSSSTGGIFDLGLCDTYKEGEWKFISVVKTDLDTNQRKLTQNQYKFTFFDQENGESVYRDVLYIVTNDSDTTEGLYKAPCINVYRYLWDGTQQYVINLWLVNNDGTSPNAPNLNGIYSASLSNYQEIGSDYPFALDWSWKKLGYRQTNFYYNIETAEENQISVLNNVVSERSEEYSYYIRNVRESVSNPFTYNLYVWDTTNTTFVKVQEAVDREVVEEKDEEDENTISKDLGTFGDNSDTDLIVLKEIRKSIGDNIYKPSFNIPTYYTISKRIYNSQSSYSLPAVQVERVSYVVYINKTETASGVNPYTSFTLTLVKSCSDGLTKSQALDLSSTNWDGQYNFIGTLTWSPLGGGSTIIVEDITINFTNFDEELIYFADAVELSDFQLYNLTYCDVKIGNTTTRVTTSTTGSLSVPSNTVVQFNIDETSLDGSAKAFIFTKQN